jgi:Fe-S cluster biogenesis protein NfuA
MRLMDDRLNDRGSREPLTLTPAAQAEVARRTAQGGEGTAFFVVTQPSPLGFNVGVGFDSGSAPPQPTHPGLNAPVRITDDDFERLRGYTIDFRDGRFVTFTDVFVHSGETPNPRSRKFTVNRTLIDEGSATYSQPPRDEDPFLARYLLEVPGVDAVFFIGNFCTVTAAEGEDWSSIQPEVGKRLQAYFAHGGKTLPASASDPSRYGELERRIVEVLEEVVRPAVQRDGGDIAFAGYDDGKVMLYMLGSCVGCPSSLATLKMGVEELLRDAIPEVREVVAIS